jgi:hypothetical protein
MGGRVVGAGTTHRCRRPSLAPVTAHVRGQSSGIELEVPLGNIWTVRDGQCVRFELFLNPNEALEAAGLSP